MDEKIKQLRIIKDVNYKGRAVCGPQATMTIPGIICCFCGDEQCGVRNLHANLTRFWPHTLKVKILKR